MKLAAIQTVSGASVQGKLGELKSRQLRLQLPALEHRVL